ncbi:MAG: terpene cyclase/mutase family protein [Planctomycetes bacterium]|nr:terpene cyclase/mutase family protein [Planctomycetota bacterium]
MRHRPFPAPALIVTAMLVLASGPFRVGADDPPFAPDPLAPVTRAAAERALVWLANQQHSNGSFSCKVGYKLNETYQGDEYEHVGVTALAGMAFLAHGDTPGRGRFGSNVARALDYVLSCVRPADGYITANGTRMYEHAFATMFLAEVYGMTREEEVRRALRQATGLIVRSQNADGGWRYQPTPVDADISVTVSTLQALRAARNVGIRVPKTTVDRAMKYVKECACNADGSFNYQNLPSMMTRSTFALTAAGITCLYSAGEYDSREIRNGLRYLRNSMPDSRENAYYHYYYGHYYACQAFYQAGGAMWSQYYSQVREEILSSQIPDGHFEDDVGPTYATAMAAILLQAPDEYLPIFQR